MPHSAPTTLRILLVDDQRATRTVVAAQLRQMGHDVRPAESGQEALALFEQERPDLVLLDVEMPDQDGYSVAQEMRAREKGGWTPIVFLSQHHSDDAIWRGIESGGDDYLTRPVSPMRLHAKLLAMQRIKAMRDRLVNVSKELYEANLQLHQLSRVDGLTGLMNRRAMDERLHEEIAHARREQIPLTLVLCDVDHFKRFNDAAGHQEGDRCLKHVANLLRDVCRRPRDCAARYGGEEFALILPNTPRAGAMTLARTLLRCMATVALPHPDSPVAGHVTLSGGITTCIPDDSTTAEGMLLRADNALYTAKAAGRNRCFSYEMQMDTETDRQGRRITA